MERTHNKQKIAVIGVGLRLPCNIHTLDGLARKLYDKADLVGRVPEERFSTRFFEYPDLKGHSATFSAGVIDNIFDFDYKYFGLSKLEAQSMDPQQRLCLQMAVDAVNCANLRQSELSGTRTGVFIGSASTDMAMSRADDVSSITPYGMVGTNLSIISNRVSYYLDLKGPSMTIDTACSSSVVALGQAVGYLRDNPDCMCFAGGVNILLSPMPFIGFSQAHMLSPDGRCRVFDHDGNGYVRSEGGALLLLKTLEKALEDGDPVMAVISDVMINQDGRTSGISLPNGEAQEQLLRDLYEGQDLSNLAYVEAHGTGTKVGDPIEVNSIGHVLGSAVKEKCGRDLYIGSIKSNIGHLETASGMAGILKAMIVLQEGRIPANIHISKLNEAIDFDGLGVKVIQENTDLPKVGGSAMIGVNSFGFGGTNGHVIMERFPKAAPRKPSEAGRPGLGGVLEGLDAGRYLRLSAASPASLAGALADYSAFADETNYRAVAANLALCRDSLACQLFLRCDDYGTLKEEFKRHIAQGEKLAMVHRIAHKGRTSFVFSGNGSQYAGMGRELLGADPLFREIVLRIDRVLSKYQDWSAVEYIGQADDKWDVQDTEKIQVLIFTLQTALAEYLRLHGIEADSACGHSVGEVAAAYYCGALSLEDACRVIVCRSRHQASTYKMGDMAVVKMDRDLLLDLLKNRFTLVEVAGSNTHNSFTLSGNAEELAEFVETARRQYGAVAKILRLNYPFHSAKMEVIRDKLNKDLGGLEHLPLAKEFYSCVDGRIAVGERLARDYWWKNIRQEVRFEQSILSQIEDGHDLYVEIGPRDILLNYVREIAKEHSCNLYTAQCTARFANIDEFYTGLHALMASGLFAHPEMVLDTAGADRSLRMPAYTFEDEPCFLPKTKEGLEYFRHEDHELLGRRIPYDRLSYVNELDTRRKPYLSGHKVLGKTIFPMAGYLNIALELGRRADPNAPMVGFDDFTVLSPIAIEDGRIEVVRTGLEEQGGLSIGSHAYLESEEFVPRAKATLVQVSSMPAFDRKVLQELQMNGKSLSTDELYAKAHEYGIDYAQGFRSVKGIRRLDRRFLLRLDNQSTLKDGLVSTFALDGTLQALFACLLGGDIPKFELQLPTSVRSVILNYRQTMNLTDLNALVEIRKLTSYSSVVDVYILDSYDQPLMVLKEVRYLKYTHPGSMLSGVFVQDLRPAASNFPLKGFDFSDRLTKAYEQGLKGIAGEGTELRSYYTALICVYILQAVRLKGHAGTVDELFGVVFDDEHMVGQAHYLLEILVANQLARKLDDERYVVEDDQDLNADKIFNTIISLFPESFVRAEMISRLGSNLEHILSGNMSFEKCINVSKDNVFDNYCYYNPENYLANTLIREFLEARAESARAEAVPSVLVLTSGNQTVLGVLEGLLKDQSAYVTICCPRENLQLQGKYACYGNVTVVEGLEALSDRGASFDAVVSADPLHVNLYLRGRLELLMALVKEGGYVLGYDLCANFVDSFINSFRDCPLYSSDDINTPDYDALSEDYLALKLIHESGSCKARFVREYANRHFYVYQKETGQHDHEGVLFGSKAAFVDLGQAIAGKKGQGLYDFLSGLDREGSLSLLDWGELSARMREPARPKWPHKSLVVSLCVPGRVSDGADDLSEICLNVSQFLFAASKLGTEKVTVLIDDVSPVLGEGGEGAGLRAQLAFSLMVLLRTVKNELGLDLRVISLDLEDGKSREALAYELSRGSRDGEVCLKGHSRLITSFDKMAGTAAPRKDAAGSRAGAFAYQRLECLKQGSLSSLEFVDDSFGELGEDEVIVQVSAVGLNYRDVMWALGLLPVEALENGFSGPNLGLECTGTVVRTGSKVRGVHKGQKVIAFAKSCFATHVRCASYAVFALPGKISFQEGAAIPVAFLTAYYSISHLARARKGERILIHGGAGGVGFAAIEIAQQLGLEIFATAGSEQKRALLRRLGVDHVYDSRTLNFYQQILADTNGRGVDVVLNSLYRQGAVSSLKLLAPFGRFIELGKRDIFENNSLRLKLFKDNLSYFGVDVDELLVYKKELAQELFGEIISHFEQGNYYPIPTSVYGRDLCVDAFMDMKSSSHIGKIVVSMDGSEAQEARSRTLPVLPEGVHGLEIGSQSACLVTGGLGGLGLQIAKYLLGRGAGAVYLVGRKDASDSVAAARIAELEGLASKSQRVCYFSADVSDASQARKAFDRIASDMQEHKYRFEAFLHCAVSLHDAYIQDLRAADFRLLISTKYQGARNFMQSFMDSKVRPAVSVLMSSITTVFGNEAQANYVFANAMLEAMTRAYAGKLKVTSFLLGPISDVGLLADNRKLVDIFENRLGFKALESRDVINDIFKYAGLGGCMSLCTLNLKAIGALKSFGESRFNLLRSVFQISAQQKDKSFLDRLMSVDAKEAVELLSQRIQSLFALQLGSSPDKINVNQNLSDLGVDSLSLMEIMATLEGELEIRSSVSQISGNSTIRQIAKLCVNSIRGTEDVSEGIVTSLERQHGVSLKKDFKARQVHNIDEA